MIHGDGRGDFLNNYLFCKVNISHHEIRTCPQMGCQYNIIISNPKQTLMCSLWHLLHFLSLLTYISVHWSEMGQFFGCHHAGRLSNILLRLLQRSGDFVSQRFPRLQNPHGGSPQYLLSIWPASCLQLFGPRRPSYGDRKGKGEMEEQVSWNKGIFRSKQC